jgi:hypothetical protein
MPFVSERRGAHSSSCCPPAHKPSIETWAAPRDWSAKSFLSWTETCRKDGGPRNRFSRSLSLLVPSTDMISSGKGNRTALPQEAGALGPDDFFNLTGWVAALSSVRALWLGEQLIQRACFSLKSAYVHIASVTMIHQQEM